jgi:3-methyladenine DNA glycosylase AlkD
MTKNPLPTLRARLTELADRTKAPRMQAYMKSEMPYHGVPMPLVKAVAKEVFRDAAFTDAAAFAKVVRQIWTGARFREERYAALMLAGHKAGRAFQDPLALPLYEFLIVDGAWWDFVDDVAVHRLGPLLASHPRELGRELRAWSRSDDLWKRRSAIICQVGLRDRVDWKLLVDAIEPALGEKEFFLRKAIGWALRSVAKEEPGLVRQYVEANAARLSGLSKREALKHFLADGTVTRIP